MPIKVNILCSSKNDLIALKLLDSIALQLSNDTNNGYQVIVHLLDKTEQQTISCLVDSRNLSFECIIISYSAISALERQYKHDFIIAQCPLDTDSIQRTRIQQQVYVKHQYHLFENGIIWQIDDDMLFAEAQFVEGKITHNYRNQYFSTLVEFYHDNHLKVDALIGKSTVNPPIPGLLYCLTQLKDLLTREYRLSNQFVCEEYHDYYSSQLLSSSYTLDFYPNLSLREKVRLVLYGWSVTKIAMPPKHKSLLRQPSSLLRGGNFIIFNPEIFIEVPHLGFSTTTSQVARRSDMIHSHLLEELGYTIADTDYWSLIHSPDLQHIKFQSLINKYEADVIGSLLITYLFRSQELEERFQFHQQHLSLIIELLNKHGYEKHLFEELSLLKKTQRKINKIMLNDLITEFTVFKKDYNTIKQNLLCKLV